MVERRVGFVPRWSRWAAGSVGALALAAASMGTQPPADEAVRMTVPMAPALSGRSLERAPLVQIRNADSWGYGCANHSDPNIPCAMYAPGYKPKVDHEDTPSPSQRGEYNVQNPLWKWPQPGGAGSTVDISYSYSNLLNGGMTGVTAGELESAVEEALSVWATYAPLNFTEVDDSGPLPSFLDLDYPPGSTPNLRFGHHAIDGGSGVLAHAYFPSGSGLAGDLHFDNGENWGVAPGGGKIDFLEVCVHELGHALGLGHQNPPPQAIMNPFYGARYSGLGTAFLLFDDQNGIKRIYGNSCAVRSIADRAKLLPFAAGIKLGAVAAPERLYTDLRIYRDRVLQSSPAGRQLVTAYYQQGPEIIQVLAKRPDLTLQALELLAAIQEPIIRRDAITNVVTLPRATFAKGVGFLKTLEEIVSDDARSALVGARSVLDAAQTVDGSTVSLNFHAVR